MKLKGVANKIVEVVSADDPIDVAIRCMWRLNIRHLPVVRDNVPVGVVSERDVLFHVCWADRTNVLPGAMPAAPTTGATRIEEIMTRPAVVLSPEDPIENAVRLMVNKRISSVPLVAHNDIVGIVTETDFLRCYNDPSSLVPGPRTRQSSVADHMSAHVHSVGPGDATLTAIRLMREKQIRHVVVMDDDQLVGIISDRDVLRGSPREVEDCAISASDLHVPHELQVEGIMTRKPETLALSASLAEAANKMVKHRIGALPILENGQLSGIITETDLLRALVADCST